MERKNRITLKGNQFTLVGPELKTGDKAPDFSLVGQDLKEVTLKDFQGKIKLLSVAVSLDTGVCDSQIRRFNCSSAGIDRVTTLSDHKNASFGENYGVLIKELRLLARAIFVVDAADVVAYAGIVPEATDSVDFESALKAVKELLAKGKAA
jgi:thiol peroxidase